MLHLIKFWHLLSAVMFSPILSSLLFDTLFLFSLLWGVWGKQRKVGVLRLPCVTGNYIQVSHNLVPAYIALSLYVLSPIPWPSQNELLIVFRTRKEASSLRLCFLCILSLVYPFNSSHLPSNLLILQILRFHLLSGVFSSFLLLPVELSAPESIIFPAFSCFYNYLPHTEAILFIRFCSAILGSDT